MGKVDIQPGFYQEIISNPNTSVLEAILNSLKKHDRNGWFKNEEKHFLGLSTDIQDIFEFFLQSIVFQGREFSIFARMSCVTDFFEQTIISFDLSFYYDSQRTKKRTYQYSWMTSEKDTEKLRSEVNSVFKQKLGDLDNCVGYGVIYLKGFERSYQSNLSHQ
jgi:hypothetical protein